MHTTKDIHTTALLPHFVRYCSFLIYFWFFFICFCFLFLLFNFSFVFFSCCSSMSRRKNLFKELILAEHHQCVYICYAIVSVLNSTYRPHIIDTLLGSGRRKFRTDKRTKQQYNNLEKYRTTEHSSFIMLCLFILESDLNKGGHFADRIFFEEKINYLR